MEVENSELSGNIQQLAWTGRIYSLLGFNTLVPTRP